MPWEHGAASRARGHRSKTREPHTGRRTKMCAYTRIKYTNHKNNIFSGTTILAHALNWARPEYAHSGDSRSPHSVLHTFCVFLCFTTHLFPFPLLLMAILIFLTPPPKSTPAKGLADISLTSAFKSSGKEGYFWVKCFACADFSFLLFFLGRISPTHLS